MKTKKMRVAMLAPPWLQVPPDGYGGIENVIDYLVPELLNLGVEVDLFATAESKTKATHLYSAYPKEQYQYILLPQYESGPIIAADLLFAVNKILEDGEYDVIHDHHNYFGPLVFSNANANLPPVVHTIHNPEFIHSEVESHLPSADFMWNEVSKAKKLYLVALSNAMKASAPESLKPIMLDPVYNAVSLKDFPFVRKKGDYYATFSRITPSKGVDIAVQACINIGSKLKMAGVVNNLRSKNKVILELANPASRYRTYVDFRYFSDQIFSYIDGNIIDYVGQISGPQKLKFISEARALLFPIRWEEPFGMAVIEALACGTPVVAMARGALPEIIEHGKTGFLANNEAEFEKYMLKVDEIDPADCRESVKNRFSAKIMAKAYLERYEQAIKLTKAD